MWADIRKVHPIEAAKAPYQMYAFVRFPFHYQHRQLQLAFKFYGALGRVPAKGFSLSDPI